MTAEETLDRFYALLGQKVVLLPIPLRTKKCVNDGWQTRTYDEGNRYHRELIAAVKRGGNIGVLLGPASNRLLALDLDNDYIVEEWIAAHPWLANTLRTKGKRGCQLWMRLESTCDYPNGKAVHVLKDSSVTELVSCAWGAEASEPNP